MAFTYLSGTEVADLAALDAVAAKNGFRVEVAVDDTHLMQVSDALHQGVHHSEGLATDPTTTRRGIRGGKFVTVCCVTFRPTHVIKGLSV